MSIKLIKCGEVFGFLYNHAENEAVLVFKEDVCTAEQSCSCKGNGWYIMGAHFSHGDSQATHLGTLFPLGECVIKEMGKVITGANKIALQINKDRVLPFSWLTPKKDLPVWK